MPRSVWTVLKLLVTSRKVWIAGISASAAVYMHIRGLISADKLASTLVALAMAVIVAIAAEDSAGKIGGQALPLIEELADFDPRCCECGAVAEYVGEGPKWYCEEHRPWDAINVVVRGL